MSVIDSDSSLHLGGELSQQERLLLAAQQRLEAQQRALAAETERIAAELAAAQANRQTAKLTPAPAPPPLKRCPAPAPAPIATPAAPPVATNAASEVATTARPAPTESDIDNDAADDASAEASTSWPRLLFGRLRAVPSWLVSMAVHLIAMLTLALITLPSILEAERELLVVSTVADAPVLETLDQVTLEKLDETPTETFDAPMAMTLESSALDDAAAGIDGDGSYVHADVDAIDVGEMGELFGDSGKGMASVAGPGGSAEFFGVKSGGRRFVFIVDSSNSMKGRKFEDAKEELVYAVRRLDKSQMFYVIFFDQDALRMFSAKGKEPEPRPVFATIENIRKLEAWLPTVELQLRTDPYDAVKFAHDLRPDAIFILSDGQFTDRGKTERFLAENNLIDEPGEGRRPKVVINTIAFYSQTGEVAMKRIAEAYKGTYRFVAPPGGKKK